MHGFPGHHKKVGIEPEGRGSISAPPAWFDAERRAQWEYALRQAPAGLLCGTDREALAIWVVACVEHAHAVQEVRSLGQVMKTKVGNAIQNPFLPIVNRQALIMMRAGAEMGFSPAARASLGRGGQDIPSGRAGQIAGTPLAQYLSEKPDRLDDD